MRERLTERETDERVEEREVNLAKKEWSERKRVGDGAGKQR